MIFVLLETLVENIILIFFLKLASALRILLYSSARYEDFTSTSSDSLHWYEDFTSTSSDSLHCL
ncbi:hypothetical protein HanRHA438_Chr00c44g0857711 [Helianthus annuus]|nr:hypothetical protein HanRHA438_Chr00c44g0857711 [Helianthus annuus]